MKQRATARFAIQNWDEKPCSEGQDLPKLTRASVTKNFTGDIEGEGRVKYLMMYRGDGSAAFVGLERIVGRRVARLRREASALAPTMGQDSPVQRGDPDGSLLEWRVTPSFDQCAPRSGRRGASGA